MSTPACPRCVIYGRPGTTWHATGRFTTMVKLGSPFISAELTCDTEACHGRTFWSGRREAVEAGQQVRTAAGDPPYVLNDPPDANQPTTPQPSLPHSRVRQPSGLADVGQLARDFKRRQSGDDTP